MFIDRFADLSAALSGHHDLYLLVLSFITASVAAWIALIISQRLRSCTTQNPWVRRAWWLSGATVMGLSISATTLVALLSLTLPVAFSFSPGATALALLPAIMASAYVLQPRAAEITSQPAQWVSAGVLGGGIALMHYATVASLDISARLQYDPAWFALSIVAAVVLSWIALRIMWSVLGRRQSGVAPLLAPSLTMGLVFAAIHHLAMLGAYFFPDASAPPAQFQTIMAQATLGWVISGGVLFTALGVLAIVLLSYRLELAALIESSARFNQELVDSANEGIVTTDVHGRIKTFSAGAQRLFGFTPEHVTGRNFDMLLPDSMREFRDFFMQGDEINLSRVINRTLEFIGRRADGSSFPAELTVTPLQRSGQLEIAGVIRDISERKRAEKEIHKHQQKMEFLLSASPIVIYTRSGAGSTPVTYVSPNVQELFGYLAEDIRACPDFWFERIHEDDRDALLDAADRLREQGFLNLEYRLRYPNGKYRWISDRQLLIRPERDQRGIIVGSWIDIHEKKEAELQVALNEQRLRIGLQCAEMASWDWIIQTGEVQWSSDMADKLGLDPDAPAEFDTFIERVHPEDRKAVKAAFKSSLVRGERFDQKYRVVWPDKSVHWVHSIGALLNDDEGNPVHMVGVLYDVTDRMRLHVAPAAAQATG